MGSSAEQPVKRSLHRLWLLVVVLVVLVTLTHFALPSTQSPSVQPYSPATLTPIDYFNSSDAQTSPFAFCPPYGPGDALAAQYGAQMLSKTRMHLGSGDRVQRVINRALAGQPVTISIIGGSGVYVTHC